MITISYGNSTECIWIGETAFIFLFSHVFILYNNLGELERVGDKPLRQVIDDLGDWPVLNRSWNGNKWSIEDTLGKLKRSYNAPFIIEVWVSADDTNSLVYILQVN